MCDCTSKEHFFYMPETQRRMEPQLNFAANNKFVKRNDPARPSGFSLQFVFSSLLIILFAIFILLTTIDSKVSYTIYEHEAEYELGSPSTKWEAISV